MKIYLKSKVILKNLKIGTVEKIVNDKYLVSYYDNNKLKYLLINESSIYSPEEYERIRNRNNIINSIIS